jgi:soluble lytic murein transglycosylase-like protein
MTPDWDAKPTSVPYASFGDPQTLNLYSYVENGPLNRVDADGHTNYDSGQGTSTQQPECMGSIVEGCMNSSLGAQWASNEGQDEARYETEVAQAVASTGNAAAQPAQGQSQQAQQAQNPTNKQVREELTRLASAYGVPVDVILATAKTESNFNVNEVNENRNKKGELVSTDYGVMQVNSTNINGPVKGPDGKFFTITDSIKSDWKANANAGVAIAAQEYKAAVKAQPNGTAESRAQQTYSGYNGGPPERSRYTQTGPSHGFADVRDYNFLMNYRSQ